MHETTPKKPQPKDFPSNPSASAIRAINNWLKQFDFIENPDDRTKVTAYLLGASGINGSLENGNIRLNEGLFSKEATWIDLRHGHIVSYNAMQFHKQPLLRESANLNFCNRGKGTLLKDLAADDFQEIAGKSIKDFSPFPKQALEPKHNHLKDALKDSNGNPILVFRGEHGKHSNQSLHTRLPSISFGSCRAANCYALSPNDDRDFGDNPKIYPCYLVINNPIPIKDHDPFFEFSLMEELFGFEFSKGMFLKYCNWVTNTGIWEQVSDELDVNSLNELIALDENHLRRLYFNTWVALDDPEFVRRAKALGYDGAIHYGAGETACELEYRVFDESQVIYALSTPIDKSLTRQKQRYNELEPA